MQRVNHFPTFARRRRQHNQRGAALIMTLLLLLLMVGLSLAMVMSAGSDMFLNSNYRNFRGSFYAADSGLNIARTDMMAQVMAAVPATFPPNVQPIPPGTDATVLAYINTTYGSSYLPLTAGSAASSWPEQYKIDKTQTVFVLPAGLAGCWADNGTPTPQSCTAPTGTIKSYHYTYTYALTAVGRSQGTEAATLTDNGTLTFVATIVPASSDTSFAGFGMFIDQQTPCSGGILVPGLISGPVFTNGGWTFGNTGSYTFTDPVGSVAGVAGYKFTAGTCDQVAGSSDTQSGKTIAPTFQGGFNLAQNSIPLPKDSYNQERAVIDSIGTAGQPTPTELNTSLRNVSQAQYPNGAPTPGVWAPYNVDPVSGLATFNGGGFLVEGDASVVLSTVGSSQVYAITQSGVTTTITVTPNLALGFGAGITTISTPTTSLTITGVPVIKDPASGAINGNATMLYMDGNVTSLSGPAAGVPAIQDGTQLTITAAKTVTVTGDILYKSQPINMPADTINPAGDTKQALGIFTATGDVQLSITPSTGNLTIDASIATLSTGGSGGIVNLNVDPKNPMNTLTIVGGRIQNQIKNINATTRNVFFDRRFGKNFGPPWFPATTINSGKDSALMQPPTAWRGQWKDQTSTY